MSKIVPRVFVRSVKRFILELKILLWKSKANSSHSLKPYSARMLVVNDKRYCFFARVAVFSFLHFHPLATVTIYSDVKTKPFLRRYFRKEISKGKVRIDEVPVPWNSWQEAKVIVIAEMTGLTDIFLDADVRFNGKLPEIINPTVFVKEFSLGEKEPFSFLNDLWIDLCPRGPRRMLNTTFIYRGASSTENLKSLDLERFRKFELVLLNSIRKNNLKAPFDDQIWRLREQIFISLVMNSLEVEISSLKGQDSRLDGEFLESAYFGSTGLGY
jgi:hypothetical protein